MSKWLDNAVFYEIYPQSFNDTNADGIGDFQGIIEKLDYIKELGCNAIWINPCFLSPFGDAGYDVADYCRVAPRYGTNEDLKRVFEEAHKRDMHVLLDLVPGHTSVEHPWFKESMKADRNEFTDRYVWTNNVWEAPEGMGSLRGISERDGACAINFFSNQPALNYGFYQPDPEKPWQQSFDDEGPQATLAAMEDVMRFWLNMGCDGFRVDMASELIGIDMKRLCFEENEHLDQTEFTQIALLTTGMAMEQSIRACGLTPDVTAGLSLGEYNAIVSAGGMEMADAMKVVRRRGILMEEAVPAGEGAMAAVLGMEAAKIEEILSGISGAYIANYNCPGQIVITGYEAAVAEASEKLKEAGAKRVLPLNVSGPFHSPMMEAASQGLTEALEGVGFMELKIPYVTNVTGQYVRDTALTRGLLIQQVASGVRWQQSIEAMIADGVDTFVEIGPGRTLTGFLRKINRDVKGYNIRTYEEMHQVCETLL